MMIWNVEQTTILCPYCPRLIGISLILGLCVLAFIGQYCTRPRINSRPRTKQNTFT